MHPSLRIEALSRLPGTLYRRTAIAAARGSRMDFYALQEDFQRRPAAAQTVELLPVFYVYLDPTVIPLPEELDTMDANVFARLVSKLDTAVKALVNIRAIVRKISEPVALDLWPRLWLWMEFLWRFREWNFLQSLSIPDRLCIYLIVEFGRHKKIKTAMARTRGVRVLLTESWSVGLHQKPAPHPAAQALTALNTTKLLQALIDEPEHIQDVIEGAGGTIDDLASLFVKHLNCAAPLRRESEAVDISAAFWTFVILFIQDFPSDLQTPFFDALQAHKIVPSLVATFCIFADITFADINEAFLHRLTPFLDESSGYPRITEALKAGLLRCVLFCGKTDITDSAQHLLYTILPDAMVYHSVLTQLELSLQDVRGSPDLIASLQPEVQDALSKFMEFAEMRIGVLKWYNSPQHVSLAACDNMDCGRISGRRDFRRCSGCRHAFYCSPECQREDWTEGCHRDFCQNLREHPGHIVSNRDISFLRALAHHDYRLARERGLHLQSRPIPTPVTDASVSPAVVLIYNDPGSPGRALVTAVSNLDASSLSDPRCADSARRVARSGGTMELHLVTVAEGSSERTRVMPLRSESGAIFNALEPLRGTVPVDTVPSQIPELFPTIWQDMKRALEDEAVETY